MWLFTSPSCTSSFLRVSLESPAWIHPSEFLSLLSSPSYLLAGQLFIAPSTALLLHTVYKGPAPRNENCIVWVQVAIVTGVGILLSLCQGGSTRAQEKQCLRQTIKGYVIASSWAWNTGGNLSGTAGVAEIFPPWSVLSCCGQIRSREYGWGTFTCFYLFWEFHTVYFDHSPFPSPVPPRSFPSSLSTQLDVGSLSLLKKRNQWS